MQWLPARRRSEPLSRASSRANSPTAAAVTPPGTRIPVSPASSSPGSSRRSVGLALPRYSARTQTIYPPSSAVPFACRIPCSNRLRPATRAEPQPLAGAPGTRRLNRPTQSHCGRLRDSSTANDRPRNGKFQAERRLFDR